MSKLLEEKKKEGFVLADVNCRLCAKVGSQFYYFEGGKEFIEILEKQADEGLNESEVDEAVK